MALTFAAHRTSFAQPNIESFEHGLASSVHAPRNASYRFPET